MESTLLRNEWTVIPVEGAVDRETVPALYLTLERAIHRGDIYLLLDMSRATYVDSAALGILVRAYKDARRRGGEVALTKVPESIRGILEYTRLDAILRQTVQGRPPIDTDPLGAA